MARSKKYMSFYDLMYEMVRKELDTIIDPRNMDPEERVWFMESVHEDYIEFKKKGSPYSERYKELLVYLVKTYGH